MRKATKTKIEITVKPQGQAGPKLNLDWSDLSIRERRVLSAIVDAGGPVTLAELAATILRNTGTDETSTIRNQLRRLGRARLFYKPAPGVYVATDLGINVAVGAARKVA